MLTICSICRESLEVAPNSPTYGGRIGTLVCGHVFHVACINTWWNTFNRQKPPQRRSYNCVTCRRSSPDPYVFEVFLCTVPARNSNDYLNAQIVELRGIIQQLQGHPIDIHDFESRLQIEKLRRKKSGNYKIFQDINLQLSNVYMILSGSRLELWL